MGSKGINSNKIEINNTFFYYIYMSCEILIKDGVICGEPVFYINDWNVKVCKKHGKNDICKEFIDTSSTKKINEKKKKRRNVLSKQKKTIKSFLEVEYNRKGKVMTTPIFKKNRPIPVQDNFLNVFIDVNNKSKSHGIFFPSLRFDVVVPEWRDMKFIDLYKQYKTKIVKSRDFIKLKKYVELGKNIQILGYNVRRLNDTLSDSTLKDMLSCGKDILVEELLYVILQEKDHILSK